jgi:spermidine export protein MdtI
MNRPEWIAFGFLAVAIALELAAEVCLKLSDGFRRRLWGLFGLGLVALAFACLGQAARVMPLPVAYAIWGAVGLVLVVLAGRLFFGQRLGFGGWVGVALVGAGVAVLQLA